MRTTILTVLFLILCTAAAGGKPDSLYYELGARGYELVLDMQYNEADKIFDKMIQMEPKNAAGYLYKSQSFFHYWQYTYVNPDKKTLKQFRSLLFKTRDIAEAMPDKDDLETQFMLGSAYGNIGLYYANSNNWLRAWWYGRKGIKCVKGILEKDPEYANAYFLIGMYNYYAATLPKVIKSLSFLLGSDEGNRKAGIEQLTRASLYGDLKDDAKIFLADSVYFEEKNFAAASALLEELTVEYPDNHYLSLIQAISYRHLNRLDPSIRTLKSALKSESLKDFPYLYGNIYYALGLAYSRINEYEKAASAQKNAYEILRDIEGSSGDQYDAWALFEIGNAYEMIGSVDAAREYYSKIDQNKRNAYKRAQTRLKKPLTPARIKLIKGKNYLRYGKYSMAEEILKDLKNTEFKKEGTSSKLKAEAHLYLGEVEYHLKKYRNSIQTLGTVFTFNNVDREWVKPWAHYWLAACYREIGDNEKAEQEYEMAYKYGDDEIRSEIGRARKNLTPF